MAIFGNRKEPTEPRSELLRKRRVENARSVTMGSTLVAPRTTWEPRPRRTAPRAYKMHSISLDSREGVEVQLPAISLSMSSRGVAIFLAAACGVAMLFLFSASMFRVSDLQVRGTNFLSADSVADASGIKGSNIFLLSETMIAKELDHRMPGILSAHVTVGMDGSAVLEVVERAPILLWVQGGDEYWVDGEGVIFPKAKTIDGMVRVEIPDHGPRIVLDGTPDVDPKVVNGVLELAVALPAGSHIVYDSQNGLGMLDPGGWPVYFGNAQEIPEKMSIYRQLAGVLSGEGIRPTLVNVEDLRQPYYRR